jgi:excinuclease UvrABC helicase subunit UvrB
VVACCPLSLAPRKMMPQLCRVSKQITRLGREMLQAAKNLEFERATELRERLK